jgi:putative membrane protein
MVKILSQPDKDAIAHAIVEAERSTSAKLVAVVAPASDVYQSYFLLYGLIIGSAIDIILWALKLITAFPLLLAIQLAVIALISFIPWLRHLLIRLVPKHVRHRRAAHRAYEEYLIVSHHTSVTDPIVLLYVSLAERYAHILTSRSVREKIPDNHWNEVIGKLTADIRAEGLRNACIKTIQHMTELLIHHFSKR